MSAQNLGSIFGQAAPPAKGRGRKSEPVSDIINDFQPDTAAIEARPDPILARITVHLLGLLIVFAIVWASFSYLDRVVTTRGKVISTVPSLVMQPIETAIVKSIDVKTGDIVKPGQVLATLDPTFTQADVAQLEARVAGLDAQIARLEAEYENRPFDVDRTTANDYFLLQHALWNERQALYRAQILSFDEKAARAQSVLAKLGNDREHLAQRLKVLREIEGMRNSLAAAQVGSRLNSLIATDSRIEIERSLTNSANDIRSAEHEYQVARAERDAFIQQWQGKVVEDLVTRRNEREGVREQLSKARKRQDLVRLEASVESVVLDIAPRSVGSVVREAEPLITLVPLNAPLEVEAQLDARNIGNIAVGDPVQVKLDAWNFMEYGMVEGEVLTISEDAFNSKDGRAVEVPYYRLRIRITRTDTLYNMPESFRLIPGTPLTAEIKIGNRSVISYFLRPILRGLNEGLREP